MLENSTILFADDEETIRKSMEDVFSFMFKEVYLAADGKEAVELFEEKKPDVVILDIEMPHLNGLQVAKKIRETDKNLPIVIATAYASTEYFLEAVELNLTAFILKPITMDDLNTALKKCVANLKSNRKKVIRITKNISYDFIQRALFIDEEEVPLRNIEMRFLEYMLKYPNRVISYTEFEWNIWEEGMSPPAIRSLVRDLRKHLPKEVIKNVSKVGYKIVIEE